MHTGLKVVQIQSWRRGEEECILDLKVAHIQDQVVVCILDLEEEHIQVLVEVSTQAPEVDYIQVLVEDYTQIQVAECILGHDSGYRIWLYIHFGHYLLLSFVKWG